MTALATSRLQRLRTLESEIREELEQFFRTGMKLKEIRDDELYKEDGFASWEEYCWQRLDLSPRHCQRLITASEYRSVLPNGPNGPNKKDEEPPQWTEATVRELTRIADKRAAARVAKKVLDRAKKEDAKLTSTFVRKVVDEELGVKRGKPKSEEEKLAELPDLLDLILNWIGELCGWNHLLEEVLPHKDYLKQDPWRLRRIREEAQRTIALLQQLTAE
jgi:hypothetical protein